MVAGTCCLGCVGIRLRRIFEREEGKLGMFDLKNTLTRGTLQIADAQPSSRPWDEDPEFCSADLQEPPPALPRTASRMARARNALSMRNRSAAAAAVGMIRPTSEQDDAPGVSRELPQIDEAASLMGGFTSWPRRGGHVAAISRDTHERLERMRTTSFSRQHTERLAELAAARVGKGDNTLSLSKVDLVDALDLAM